MGLSSEDPPLLWELWERYGPPALAPYSPVLLLVGVVSTFLAAEAAVDVPDVALAIEVTLALDFGLFGPRTRPSFAYSHTKPRVMHRLQDGCSPLHYIKIRDINMIALCPNARRAYFGFSRTTLLAGLCCTQTRVLWSSIEDASSWV